MKFFAWLFNSFLMVMLGACAISPQGKAPALQDKVETQLKISTGGGRVRAKLLLTNQGPRELVLNDLRAKNFKIETADGQILSYKGEVLANAESLRLKPGQSLETAFNLHQSFPFKDRLTRYKIRFENAQVRSNDAQVWY
jgi:hypothetical protein